MAIKMKKFGLIVARNNAVISVHPFYDESKHKGYIEAGSREKALQMLDDYYLDDIPVDFHWNIKEEE